MSKISRKDFFSNILRPSGRPKEKNNYDITKDKNFIKYSNKELPLKIKHTRSSTISAYTGVFTEKLKIHLLKRTMFGVKEADLTALQSLTVAQAVDALIDALPTTPPDPINYYESLEPDHQGVAFGSTWINAGYNDTNGTVNYYRYVSVQSWWVSNILNQPLSIEEKMIVFWHNHFATAYDAVGEPRLYYNYIKVLKQFALGNFKEFVKAITLDSQMLVYLNGQYNNKYNPDENYARELQELFTIGIDPSYYTQADVQEMAKVLTGFRVDVSVSTNNYFDETLHDETNKTFSSFYGNTVINGISGPTAVNELDDLLDMIFTKDVIVAKFICRKLYKYFIHYDIDTFTETNIITPLATTFIANNWEIKPVLKQLFKSEHFFDGTSSTDCLIRNPMDLLLGLIRTAKVNIPAATSILNAHQTNDTLAYLCEYFSMKFGSPPNVAGWPAYHQSPQYHQIWINSDTLPNRMEQVDRLFTDYGMYISGSFQIKSDVIEFAKVCATPEDPDALINFFMSRLLSFTFTQTSKDYYKAILLSGQASNYYWTNAWYDYIANPTDPILEGTVRARLQQLLTELCRLPEHHIA